MQSRIGKAAEVSVGIVVFLGASLASATDYFWTGGSGNWNSTGWSNTADGPPTLPPPSPDFSSRDFFLHNSGPTDVTVTVADGVVSPFVLTDTVNLNATGTGLMTLSIVGGDFNAEALRVGTSGTGTVNQSSGNTNALGVSIGTYGTYHLSGGSQGAETLFVNGTFNQTGGESNYGGFHLGNMGTYNLSAGSLQRGGPFGNSFDGTFNQTGGNHSAVLTSIGGTYNLSGGSFDGVLTGISGTFNQSGGSYRVSGGPLTSETSIGGTYNLEGGTLSGSRITNRGGAFNFTGGTLSIETFDGNLANNGGTLAPGNAVGVTNVLGNYTQSRSGTYAVDIGGLAQGTEYDTLSIGSTAYLNGLLSVSFLDLGTGLFSPQFGDSFDVLSAEQIFGGFGSFSLPDLARNEAWRITYLADAFGTRDVVRLSVAPVPEPEIYVLMLTGLGLLGFVTHRKQQKRVSNLAAA